MGWMHHYYMAWTALRTVENIRDNNLSASMMSCFHSYSLMKEESSFVSYSSMRCLKDSRVKKSIFMW